MKSETENIREILSSIPDPEVPVLTIIDLGIVRDVNVISRLKSVEIKITPTYTGCPAIDVISMNIRLALLKAGYKDVIITKVLTPVWSTDWISDNGKQKLKSYGIAPPGPRRNADPDALFSEEEKVQCPQCNSSNTLQVSEFGSTACKSLYRCNTCGEPFEYFKCY